MNRVLPAFLLLALLVISERASGQIAIELKLKRTTYILNEPLVATVTISNNSGRDLFLEDGQTQWFGFVITRDGTENLVSPRDLNYKLDPLDIPAGELRRRVVDLQSLFEMDSYGVYTIKATIYSKELKREFVSKADLITISEGRTLWSATVGIPTGLPNAGDEVKYSILTFTDVDRRYLYLRVVDEATGGVRCTHNIGRSLDRAEPMPMLDSANNLYILHLVGSKTYQLTHVGLTGEVYSVDTYAATAGVPRLKRRSDGDVVVIGAKRIEAPIASDGMPAPKLSDRPAGLPTVAAPPRSR